jgi:hypothetical protein
LAAAIAGALAASIEAKSRILAIVVLRLPIMFLSPLSPGALTPREAYAL